MVKVAIAGGSSPTLGHSLVSALLATNGRHTPIILSRKKAGDGPASSTTVWSASGATPSTKVETRYVDYESNESLVAALRDVDTVISVLLIHDPDQFMKTQLRLLRAAEAAGCRRFAPSEFSTPYKAHSKIDFEKQVKVPVWEAVLASKIDAAIFSSGMFMNYLAIGCPERGGNRAEALAGFAEGPFLFNLVEGWVDVPVAQDEDGAPSPVITMTNIRDIGRFVAAAIDLEEPWGKRELGMAGSTLSFDEIVLLIEKYTGQKIERRPFTKQQLREREANAPEGVAGILEHMECQLKAVCCDGEISIEPTLNRLCPGVEPMTIKDFLRRYWAEPSGNSA